MQATELQRMPGMHKQQVDDVTMDKPCCCCCCLLLCKTKIMCTIAATAAAAAAAAATVPCRVEMAASNKLPVLVAAAVQGSPCMSC